MIQKTVKVKKMAGLNINGFTKSGKLAGDGKIVKE